MSTDPIEADGAKAILHLDAPTWNGARTAALGGIRVKEARAADALLEAAATRARALGFEALLGPMDGDTWHSYRLVTETDGRAPFLMEPSSPDFLLPAFQRAGFETVGRYFSADRPLETARPHPEVRPWDGSDPEALFAQVHALSSEAFAGNPFYKPISLADFLAMYLPVVPLLVPDLILFTRAEDRLTGFLFGIPDYAQGPKTDTAILKSYASLARGAGRALADTFHANAAASGHARAIHALIHDTNESADRSRREGGRVFRRYALMGRRLG